MDNKAEKRYIEIMREKTGEGRLKIAMDLRKFVIKLAEENIRNRNPGISSENLKKEVLKRQDRLTILIL
ncbi:MAG: hypothetical protein NTW46_00485 [Candidatus Nealsonbacteria bacterium]|nr:hypothetical protein [Candidatus Nealsonbacteria bacterium]